MSEGPQVKLRTEWLSRTLTGQWLLSVRSVKAAIRQHAGVLEGRRVNRCFCKGKHIFIACEGGYHVHNHLLMRGRWRKISGQLLLEPPGAWLSLYVGPYTVCNIGGQMLRIEEAGDVERALAELGPDVMEEPYPRDAVHRALRRTRLPVAEALLDQRIVSGLGNVARSEALFVAGLDPRAPAPALGEAELATLDAAIRRVMWESYHEGGRWRHRVYHRTGEPCEKCHAPVRRLRLAPSRRAVFFCPACQKHPPVGSGRNGP